MIALPPQNLTPDEARGFSIACGVFATFGRQLAETVSLPGQADQARLMRDRGRFLATCARAFDRQLGAGALPEF